MDYLAPFLREGILGSIIIVEGMVIVYLNNKVDKKDIAINELQDKRVVETNQFTTSFTEVAKDMVSTQKDLINQNAILQKAVDNMVQTFQSFINAVNARNGKDV